MPVQPPVTYPGVYIQEVESNVRTIMPVATANTAFIGRAKRGPLNIPVICNNFADFQRTFGGLWEESLLGYAVSDFFNNGGTTALILRVFRTVQTDPTDGSALPAPALAQLKLSNDVVLEALNPGTWSQKLKAAVSVEQDADIRKELAARLGVDPSDVFNLTVWEDIDGGASETFGPVTVKKSPRRLDGVLVQQSQLVRVAGGKLADTVTAAPTALPAPAAPAALPAPEGTTAPAPATALAAPAAPPVITVANADALNDGFDLKPKDLKGDPSAKQGIYALDDVAFNLLVFPQYQYNDQGEPDADLLGAAASYCAARRAMLLLDSPAGAWDTLDKAKAGFKSYVNIAGAFGQNAAFFYPRIKNANPLHDGQIEDFSPIGAIAGVMARTDTTRGVWKAPAGLDAVLAGVVGLTVPLTDAQNGQLNPLGINCLRSMASGNVIWGARTLKGDDRLANQWKYIPVRRTALFIEESLYQGTQWAVFEPNDEPLWSQLRLNIGSFMHELFRQGAFQGSSPKDAYFVQCDANTTTQADIDKGIVNIYVGFAPLKPAEFVILYIQQKAGTPVA
jgi:uncharacterized protein